MLEALFCRLMKFPSSLRSVLRAFSVVALLCVAVAPAADAQSSLRSSFPGRRIGGGPRGECSARFLANLVPASSVFSPGSGQLIGLLEGPSANTHPLVLSFSPYTGDSSSPSPGSTAVQRVLPASSAGLVLVAAPAIKGPTSWESTYRCPNGSGSAAGSELDFVQSASPPALSLLLPKPDSADQPIQTALKRFHQACGKTIPLSEVATAFNLTDALGAGWPLQIPVRCP